MAKKKQGQARQARRELAGIDEQLDALHEMTVAQLRERYEEVFEKPARSRNKDYLRKKVGWRIQELAEGGLSDKAKAKIEELAEMAPARWRSSGRKDEDGQDPLPPTDEKQRDPRLPPPGKVITRMYKGEEHQVTVLRDGFEYRGERYPSLSRIARKITGTNWNGYLFWGLQRRTSKRQAEEAGS